MKQNWSHIQVSNAAGPSQINNHAKSRLSFKKDMHACRVHLFRKLHDFSPNIFTVQAIANYTLANACVHRKDRPCMQMVVCMFFLIACWDLFICYNWLFYYSSIYRGIKLYYNLQIQNINICMHSYTYTQTQQSPKLISWENFCVIAW